ncbi:SDR family NAD(P)-dependent oxidoreductase [Nocardia sp. NPDC050712]|uniref:SDR family NAD(P)-dependent oxidoreductase n=1 Tax=Nocardia sp. NPDC050712 TaxID=3155518 RepID=UPI0034081889
MASNPDPLPDQTGRTFVITGANGGLGAVVTETLAAAGARVIMACRDPRRAQSIADRAAGDVSVAALDLADLASIRAFSAECGEIDVLINLAGVMNVPFARTTDGFEMHCGINYLGHFALTGRLLGRISDRVISVSSIAHQWTSDLAVDDLSCHRRRYRRSRAYAQSKLATLIFGRELQRRFRAAGSERRSYAVHPGVAPTPLVARTGTPLDYVAEPFIGLVGQSRTAAARSTLFAATSADADPEIYWGPTRLLHTRGPVGPCPSSALSQDRALAAQLWLAAEAATDVRYRFDSTASAT